MKAQDLKNSILQLAIQGKLVEQDPNDEPASVLLEKIKAEKAELIKQGKIKKDKQESYIFRGDDNKYYEKIGSETKDITDEIPFDIPDNWEWVRIGSIEEINLGFTYKPEYVSEGIDFLSVKDISSGKIDFNNTKKVSVDTYDKASYGSKPRKGDILFGRVGTIGKPQIVETDNKFCIFVSLGFFRDHTNLLCKKYICMWMESWLFFSQVAHQVKGAVLSNLNTSWLKEFLIPLPPLEEQKRIVSKIEELEPFIEEYGKAETELTALNCNFPEQIKKSILQYAIQGKLVEQDPNDEPASVLLEKIKEEKAELIKQGKIKKDKQESYIYKGADNRHYEKIGSEINDITEEIPFDIPNNWSWCRLGSVSSLITDGTHKTPIYKDKGIPFISVQNISSGKFEFNKIKYISEDEHKILSKRVLPIQDDILFCRIGTLGKAIKYTLNYEVSIFVSLGLIRLISKDIVEYVIELINSPLGYKWIEDNKVGGGTHTFKINLEDVKYFLIPLPPLAEQKRIIEKLENIMQSIKTL